MPIISHPFTNHDVMAYLDGELSPDVAAEMKAHLAQCRACQDIAADLQGVSRQLSEWIVEPPQVEGMPAPMTAALEERALGKKNTKEQPRAWLFVTKHPWALAAASVLCVVGLVFFDASERRGTMATPAFKREANLAVTATDAYIPTPKVPAEPARNDKRQLLAQFSKATEPTLLVVRSGELRLTAYTFDSVRADVDRILAQFDGHIAELNITSPPNEGRSLNATLRIPAAQLDAALKELRKLGRVSGESQRGEEVTQQSIDLDARLANSRHTEERLTQILATRTGKLSDVLEVEEKLAQVRGEIERAEAEQKSLNNLISFATVTLEVSEDYSAPLSGGIEPSIGTKLRNAGAKGIHGAFDAVIGMVQFFLTVAPTLLLLSLLLGLPTYFLWKKLRHR